MALRNRDTEGQMSFSFAGDQEGITVTTKKKKKSVTKKKTKTKKTAKKISPTAPKKTAKKIKTKVKKTTAQKKLKADKTRAKTGPAPIRDDQIEKRAQEMAARQRDISISEFFAKNRHLLGFDNPRKALLTTVKEAVDNSLDACEEANILPEIEVGIKQIKEDRFRVWVQDNGPGIVKNQIPNIFGRLLYGSKFHTLRMARGQQGIGISAAGMYGLLTTGKSIEITSRTGPRSQAHYYQLRIDTKKNRPDIIKDEIIEWDARTGTRVEIELEARYQRGRQSVDEYLAQTAITNPHTHLRYILPDGQIRQYERTVKKIVTVPKAIKPHPYGVELGILIKMAKDTAQKSMSAFLAKDFSRVSPRISQQILEKAGLSTKKRPKSLLHAEAEKLYKAISQTKIMAPGANCVVPIGEKALLKGLEQVVAGDFYTACTRGPAVYRGNPFQIEVGLTYGGAGYINGNGGNGNGKRNGNADEHELMRVLRYANRVPLLYQQSACAIFKSILQTNWRHYGLSQSRGALPSGPITVIVHMASVWVPFTSESKEAVAHYPEIIKEIKLALADCGRRLGKYLRGQKRKQHEALKRSYIEKYLPPIGEALKDILSLKDKQVKTVVNRLEEVLEKTRS